MCCVSKGQRAVHAVRAASISRAHSQALADGDAEAAVTHSSRKRQGRGNASPAGIMATHQAASEAIAALIVVGTLQQSRNHSSDGGSVGSGGRIGIGNRHRHRHRHRHCGAPPSLDVRVIPGRGGGGGRGGRCFRGPHGHGVHWGDAVLGGSGPCA